MPRPRAQDYDEKRRGILRQAADLFARHGYTGASITMIAEACAMSKALLYHYYTDKESLLFDIISNHLTEIVATLEPLTALADPRVRLRALATGLLDAYRDADQEHQVQLSGLKLLPQARQERLKDMERHLVRIFAEALGEALPAIGGRRELLMPLTMSLFGMLNWHYLWFREGRGLSREAYAVFATELVLSGAIPAAAATDAG
jgi:AcrR family transcriptional regulator